MDYTQELNRTKPDFIVYNPGRENGNVAENQHFLVVPDSSGAFIAFWTTATREASKDQRVVTSRSNDLGKTWSPPEIIDGQENDDGKMASWGFPIIVPHSGRIYFFYNKHVGISDVRDADTGQMRFRYSDDSGKTWSRAYVKEIARSAISHPDPKVPNTWIVWQVPVAAADGIPIAGFTRWSSKAFDNNSTVLTSGSELWFLRFENILHEDNPEKIEVRTLPNADFGVRVPRPDNPQVSIAQEPSIALLPDNRLFCVMRTFTGYIWYTISLDNGVNWSSPQVLRYCDEGPYVKQPLSSCPIYKLNDGRYLLFL